MLADRDCPAICAFRAVMAYISAAQRVGWHLTAGHIFPEVTAEGGRGRLAFYADRMTAHLQRYLRMVELSNHFTMRSFEWEARSVNPLPGRPWTRSSKIMAGRQSRLRSATSGLPLADMCRVARGNVARVTRTLASYHCRQSSERILQRVQERTESMLKFR